MPWFKRFYDPIVLPDGRKLPTLRDADEYITELPSCCHVAAIEAAFTALSKVPAQRAFPWVRVC
jgi:hypothetical protein